MLDRNSPLFREVFEETEILKKPTTGFLAGYHNLPYIVLGRPMEKDRGVVEIRGRISVSPKFVVSPEHLGPTYGEMFGSEGMDESIVGRIFAFPYLRKQQVSFESDDFSITSRDSGMEAAVAAVYDELERKEIINTGVIYTPNIKLYPISIEKLILKVLDREFE
jgi:hypothetical protein